MITLKGILIFASGAVCGAIGSWYCSKRHYDKILEDLEVETEKRVREEYGDVDSYVEEEDTAEAPVEGTERKGPFATPYNSFYKKEKPPVDPAEKEHPEEGEETKDKKHKPRVIKNEEFGDHGFTEVHLEFYTENEALVIADETDVKEVDEVKDWIEDALDRFGFRTNDQEVICVRNFDRKCDYQIEKVWDRFAPPDDYE